MINYQYQTPSRSSPNPILATIVGITLGLLVLLIIGWLIWWLAPTQFTSPISNLTRFRFFVPELRYPVNNKPKIVYGFLPYWNLSRAELPTTLTHVAYFALSVSPTGSLTQGVDEEGTTAYNRMQSEAFLEALQTKQDRDIASEIVIKQFASDDLQTFLNSSKAQENFYTQLDSVLLAYPFTGVNLDFEINTGGTAIQDRFTNFVKNLDDHLARRHPNVQLSIDVFASAAEGGNIWNLEDLEPYVDYIIVMAYDFHRRNSPQTGPVAPLLGSETWSSNINSHLKDILIQVPPQKVVLGIPFYGYEWQTTSANATALTYPDTGRTATYERVQELLANKDQNGAIEQWNEESLSPYLTYKEDGKQYVLYFDNSRSISYKMDYINQLGLGGVAIWALGYEGETVELWEVIGKKLREE